MRTIVVDYDERHARNERHAIAEQGVPLLKMAKLVRVVVAKENQHHIKSHAEHLLRTLVMSKCFITRLP
jgi:hypothetical protein